MPSDGATSIRATAPSALPEGVLPWLQQVCASPPLHWEALAGGAGARRYWRLHHADGGSSVFMWALPEDPAILPPALRSAPDAIPFLEVARFLDAQHIPVPCIHAADSARRWILVEDLGSRHLCDLEGDARQQAHRDAVELLARVHGIAAPESGEPPLPFRRSFDAEWIGFELDLFLALDWSPPLRRRLEPLLKDLAQRIAALPRVLSLRDYQSQNLLLDAAGRLRVIDFQDALLAAPGLDLASLLWDSYLPISVSERAELLGRYSERAPHAVPAEELALVALQRKCKDLSRFHRLIHVRGDRRYQAAYVRAAEAIRESAALLPAELADLCAGVEDALHELGA